MLYTGNHIEMSAQIMSGTEKRNGEIEFFRFFFAIFVLLSHMDILPYGGIAVDFFFALTGYLTMASLNKAKTFGIPCQSTFSFVFRKIKSFYPELLISIFLAIVVHLITGEHDEKYYLRPAETIINNVLLIKMAGLCQSPSDLNGPTWFLSSMILAILVVYPLLRKFGVNACLFVLAISICGFLCTYHGSLTSVYDWIGFTYEGNIRAVGDILLGAFAFPVVQAIRRVEILILGRMLVCVARYVMIGVMLYVAMDTKTDFQWLSLLAAWGIIVIAFSRTGVDSFIFNNRWCLFLGKLSLPLYLSHRSLTRCVINPFACIAYSIIAALMVMLLASLLRRATPFIYDCFVRRKAV